MINKVLYFKTECNEIFHKNKNENNKDNIMDLNQILNEKNINEKKVNCSTIIVNKNDNNKEKILEIIKLNLEIVLM